MRQNERFCAKKILQFEKNIAQTLQKTSKMEQVRPVWPLCMSLKLRKLRSEATKFSTENTKI